MEQCSSACSNATRGLFAGGVLVQHQINIIEYITISSQQEMQLIWRFNKCPDDLSSAPHQQLAVFLVVDMVLSTSTTNTIDYVTILTQRNAVDFGDLT
jgi:hypothetical protein